MLLYLGEPPVRFLWFCCQFWSSFRCCIFICWCSSFCCCSSFTFSFRRHLWPFRGLSPGFYTHFILSAQPIAEWFAILSFSTIPLSSCHNCYALEWAFFIHRYFLPDAPLPTFWPAFIKPSLGARAGSSSLKCARLHTDPRNTDPVHLFVWLTVIHKLPIPNDSVLNSIIYDHELLVVKV